MTIQFVMNGIEECKMSGNAIGERSLQSSRKRQIKNEWWKWLETAY